MKFSFLFLVSMMVMGSHAYAYLDPDENTALQGTISGSKIKTLKQWCKDRGISETECMGFLSGSLREHKAAVAAYSGCLDTHTQAGKTLSSAGKICGGHVTEMIRSNRQSSRNTQTATLELNTASDVAR